MPKETAQWIDPHQEILNSHFDSTIFTSQLFACRPGLNFGHASSKIITKLDSLHGQASEKVKIAGSEMPDFTTVRGQH